MVKKGQNKTVLRELFVPGWESQHGLVLLGLLTLIGAVLRIFLINQPIQYDEAYTFIHYASQSPAAILANYSAPNNHIFHTVLVALTYQVLGASPWILRIPALSAGILMIPAAYLAARRFYSEYQSLAVAAALSITPLLIEYSANGRGYTLLTLFALLLTNFAGILIKKQSTISLIAFGITAALGFYTIPIFLYPMAGISLWLAVSYLVESSPWRDRLHKLLVFLITCVLAGGLTLLLYSPVIFWGTGIASLVSNEIVESQNWHTFLENLSPRLINTGYNWMTGIAPVVRLILLGGFTISLLFYKKISNQKLPLQIFLVIGAFVFMLIQRVVPLFRVWLYLDAFYMLFAASGLAWVVELFGKKLPSARLGKIFMTVPLLLIPLLFLGYSIQGFQAVILKSRDIPEKHAAAYIQSHIHPEDTIIALPPIDIQTAYYLVISGVPFERFYRPDNPPSEIRNALVVLRDNSKYSTPLDVLKYYEVSRKFIISRAVLVFEYGHLDVYNIPGR